MSGYGGKGKERGTGKGNSMSGQWAEAGQTIIAPHRFNVTVAKLSGEVILDKVELEGTEKVSDIIDMGVFQDKAAVVRSIHVIQVSRLHGKAHCPHHHHGPCCGSLGPGPSFYGS